MKLKMVISHYCQEIDEDDVITCLGLDENYNENDQVVICDAGEDDEEG